MHEKRRIAKRALSAMLSLIMGITMVSPVFAAKDELVCGKEEHTHTDACYNMVLVCGKTEGEKHKHSDSCYADVKVLVCGQEECAADPGHAHTAECYDADGNLICGQEERPATAGHTHTDACYETQRQLVCTISEEEEHHHTSACYVRSGKPKCGKAEHTHTDACWSNHAVDVSSPEIWEQDFEELELTSIWPDDLVAVAETQLGRGESVKNYVLRYDGSMKGYTRYSEWYNLHVYKDRSADFKKKHLYDDWCASFVSFCLYYAGIPREAIGWENGVRRWIVDFQEAGIYEDAWETDYVPQSGDIVFFSFDGDKKADHVGIVKSVDTDEKTLVTIEGNNGRVTKEFEYKYEKQYIVGYCNVRKAQAMYMVANPPEPVDWRETLTEKEEYVEPAPEIKPAEEVKTKGKFNPALT